MSPKLETTVFFVVILMLLSCQRPTAHPPPAPSASEKQSPFAPAPATNPDVLSFIQFAAPLAQESQRDSQVPASVTIAQAALESAWGISALAAVNKNYFGIKCPGMPTPRHCADGYRAYDAAEDSFIDHGRFLRDNPRYRNAFSFLRDPERFAEEVARAGYAEDAEYFAKLKVIMDRYDLDQYDLTAASAPTSTPTPTPPSMHLRDSKMPSQQPAWVVQYDGQPDNRHIARAMAVDDEGNVYVTGRVKLLQQGQAYMGTIKYDSSGREVWVRWEAGPLIPMLEEVWERQRQFAAQAGRPEPDRLTTSWAHGVTIALDRAGSVYVAGYFSGNFSGSERGWVVVKYNSQGRRLWATKGPSISEPPVEMAVDEQGSIYVIGNVLGDGKPLPGNDFLTVKYSPNGDVLWSRREGQGWLANASTVSVDGQGNAFVGGSYYKPDVGWYVTTVSYTPDGAVRWIAKESAGQHAVEGMASRASDDGVFELLVGGCTGLQWLTYSPDGHLLSAYPALQRPTVRARRGGETEIVAERLPFTAKLCEDQVAQLTHGPDGSGYLVGFVHVFLPVGDFVSGELMGYERVLSKIDTKGQRVWRLQYEGGFFPPNGEPWLLLPAAIAVDHEQSVYLASALIYGRLPLAQESLTGYMTVKFDPDGKERWLAIYKGQPTSQDGAYDIALDGQGHLYAAVYSGGWEECQLWLYDPNGLGRLLSRRVAYDDKVLVAANPEGGAYLLCKVQRQVVSNLKRYISRYILARHDQSGTVVWSVELTLGGEDEWPGGSSNIVDMLADEGGNLYLVAFDEVNLSGNASGSGSGFRLLKYNPQGQLLWTVRRSTEGQVLTARFLKIHTLGRLLVIGHVLTKPGDENSWDVSVLQYDAEGKELWEARADFGGRYLAEAAITDNNGNIYVTGSVGPGIPDIGTVKYDSRGNKLWTAKYDGGRGDSGSAITVDTDGNIYVSGNSYPTEITIMYTPDGRQAWVHRHQVRPRQMLVTPAGTPVLVGITLPGSGVGTASIAIVAFDQMGGAKWVALYDGGPILSEWDVTIGGGRAYRRAKDSGITYEGSLRINRVISDPDGNLFVAGSICKELIQGTQRCHNDALILKFATE